MNFRQQCAIYHKSRKYADILKNIIVYGFMLAIFLIFFFCVFGRLSWIWNVIICIALFIICPYIGGLLSVFIDKPVKVLFYRILKNSVTKCPLPDSDKQG